MLKSYPRFFLRFRREMYTKHTGSTADVGFAVILSFLTVLGAFRLTSMLRQTATLFLVLSLTLGAQQKSSNQPTGLAGVMVRGDGFEGVIFPAEMKAMDFDPRKTKKQYWTPSEANIIEAEGQLITFLQQAKVPRFRKEKILQDIKAYKRQYVGIVENGEPDLLINFFCDSGHVEWTKHFVVVYDGGPCFFKVTFSGKTKTFHNLQVNGRG